MLSEPVQMILFRRRHNEGGASVSKHDDDDHAALAHWTKAAITQHGVQGV